LLLLIETHRALERLVLTRHQLATKAPLESAYADLSYRGLFYEPLMRDIEAFIDSTQKVVTGETVMKLNYMSAIQVSVSSPYSLVREDVARYAQMASWKGTDAEVFIKLYGLQQKIAYARKKGR